MASSRSVRNGASSTAPSDPALIQQLLVEGTALRPDALVDAAATSLEGMGLIAAERQDFVLCRNELDRDFHSSRDGCRARIVIHEALDEEDGDVRCPDCGRSVRPNQHRKQRFQQIHPRLDHTGIDRWLESQLGKVGAASKVAAGVWSCHRQGWPASRYAVLIEHADDQGEHMTEEWAISNRVVFIAIQPDLALARGLGAAWATPVALADVVAGTVDLGTVFDQIPERTQKTRVNAGVRLYASGHRDIAFQPAQPASTGRQFIVELTDRSLLINGQVMLQANATSQMAVFRVLLKTFAEDLCENVPVAEFRSMTIDEIAAALPKPRGQGDVVTDETARTHLNRFQRETVDKWRKQVGSPINDQDIIQTMTGEGREGYRINPATVIIRPRRS